MLMDFYGIIRIQIRLSFRRATGISHVIHVSLGWSRSGAIDRNISINLLLSITEIVKTHTLFTYRNSRICFLPCLFLSTCPLKTILFPSDLLGWTTAGDCSSESSISTDQSARLRLSPSRFQHDHGLRLIAKNCPYSSRATARSQPAVSTCVVVIHIILFGDIKIHRTIIHCRMTPLFFPQPTATPSSHAVKYN
jgi:hypothetical protein